MNKAYIFRLNPTEQQTESLKQHAGSTRWLWNQMLSLNIERYDQEQKFNFWFDMNNMLPELRQEHDWLKQVPAQVLQQKNRDQDLALKRKGSDKSGVGFPKFKKKSSGTDSFRLVQFFKARNKEIYLPKIGWIKWKINRKMAGKVKNITIKQDLDKWVAIVLTELPDIKPKEDFHVSEVVGIDMGLNDFAVYSDGTKISNPKHLDKSKKRLKKRQRQLSHKKLGSNQRAQARHQVAKVHRKIKNQRKDFLWKLVNSITKKYQVVCLESLDVKNMMKNKRLSRSIGSAGWSDFKTKLGQKLREMGGLVLETPKFYPSTKTCSSCGFINNDMKLNIRDWTCTSCNVVHDRDINAAINIKEITLKNRVGTTRIHGYGDTYGGDMLKDMSSYVSMKYQNPVTGLEITRL